MSDAISSIKKFEGYVHSSGGDHWVEMEESPQGEYVALSDYNQLLQQLKAAEAKATRPAPCEHACESKAFEIEIRQLTARAETAESALREAREQKPVGWLSEHGDFSDNHDFIRQCRNAGFEPVYKNPVPTPKQDRITEQDAREILMAHMGVYPSVGWSLELKPAVLRTLNKLNSNPAPQQAAAIPEGWRLYKHEFGHIQLEQVGIDGKRKWSAGFSESDDSLSFYLHLFFMAMLSAAPKPGTQNKSVPDGYRLVPFPLPAPEQLRAAQLRSEVGGYICGNWANGYDCLSELYRVMVEAYPQLHGDSERHEEAPAPKQQIEPLLGVINDLSSVIRSTIMSGKLKGDDMYRAYGGSSGSISNLLEWADAMLAEAQKPEGE